MALSTVILAAGKGTRMYSKLPKVLHPLGGKTLLEHVVHTAMQLDPASPPLVVYGHEGDLLRHSLAHLNVSWVEQTQQLGTGHALQQALNQLPPHHRVLVLYGDVPLIQLDTLRALLSNTPAEAIGIITAQLPDPTGFGRIIRNEDQEIVAIVEEKDANEEERAIDEINSGIYLFPENYLSRWLPILTNHNAQQEFYLTDLIGLAVNEQVPICSHKPQHEEEILGVNNRLQLACLERFYQETSAEKLMLQGVTLRDPHRFDLRGEISVGQDVVIDINVICEGHVTIGNNCYIGPNTFLRNVKIGDNVEVKANSVIDGAEIADECIIGPFARIRPGTMLASHAHVGNFVEIKNSAIGVASKVNHLSYIGDCEIGQQVNVGAGTITCNYDGVNKHKTIIYDRASIGSNTALVAPITIGAGATIGAGSTLTRNAPPNQLTLCRAQQLTIESWQRPKNKREKEA